MTNMIKKIDELCLRLFSNKLISNGLVMITLATAAVYFCMASVLNPWSVKLPALDSAVWLRCGVGMLQGDVMYVDIWDHKGPVLFLIHYLGLMLTPHSLTGVWLLECVFLFASFMGFYLTASLISESKMVRVLAVLCPMHCFSSYFVDGDIVEEWALPFMAFSLYFFAGYLKTAQLKKKHIFLAGVFCALSFLLNGNLISIWAAFVPVIFFKIIFEKKWDDLKQCCIYFLAGLFFILAITAGVLVIQGSFGAFLEAYFGFNQSYIGSNILYKIYTGAINAAYFDPWFGYVHVGLLVLLLHQRRLDWKYSAFIYSGAALVLLNLSGRPYTHYLLQLIPCMVIPFAVTINTLYMWCRARKEFVFIIFLIFFGWVRFDVDAYTERIQNTMNVEDNNNYAGGPVENYLIVNEWLNYRWSDEQIEKWVINDTDK